MTVNCFRLAALLISVFSSAMVFSADNAIVVFHESGFPAADSASAPDSLLASLARSAVSRPRMNLRIA